MGGRGSSGAKLNLANPREQLDNYEKSEINALYRYTSSSAINKYLGLDGYKGLDSYDREYVDNLDRAISKSGFNEDYIPDPENGRPEFLRGGGGSMVGVPKDKYFGSPQALADYINENCVGKSIVNKGYTSISTDPSVADLFASGKDNAVILHYSKIKKSTNGAYVSGGDGKTPISLFGSGEDETILQRNVKTIPIRAWTEGGSVHVAVMASGGNIKIKPPSRQN